MGVFVPAVWSFFPLKSIDFYPFLFHLHLQPTQCLYPLWQKGASLFKYLFLFIYLAVLGFSCGMQDLVPPSGIEPGPLPLGVRSLNHRTTRKVPGAFFI